MENRKPNVIPTQEQIDAANAANVPNLGDSSNNQREVSEKEAEAIKQIENEAMKQKQAHENGEKVIRPELAFEKQHSVAVGNSNENQKSELQPNVSNPSVKKAKIENNNTVKSNTEKKLINVPYDIIPLPSEGKLYPHKKTHIKIAYLNASDENILTSPNLLESGKFLSVLLNRKILDEDINLNDLHVGDRNAIMIWLRATGFGEMYPIIVYDDDEFPHEVNVDLSTLKYKKLGAETDDEGLFDFEFPKTKKHVKFKLLNIGEIDEIEELTDKNIEEGLNYSNLVTDRLNYIIVDVDGVRDKEAIKNFIQVMPIADSRALRNYYDKIESNVDLKIKVELPEVKDDETGEVHGGGLVETFLPININFFWPDLEL